MSSDGSCSGYYPDIWPRLSNIYKSFEGRVSPAINCQKDEHQDSICSNSQQVWMA